jgi:hypothetical protein
MAKRLVDTLLAGRLLCLRTQNDHFTQQHMTVFPRRVTALRDHCRAVPEAGGVVITRRARGGGPDPTIPVSITLVLYSLRVVGCGW